MLSISQATRASTRARGYGSTHKRNREREDRRVQRGGVICWRCGEPIEPGTAWDLGHDDRDRTIYRGPEHASCNRATSSHRPPRKRPAEPHPGDLDGGNTLISDVLHRLACSPLTRRSWHPSPLGKDPQTASLGHRWLSTGDHACASRGRTFSEYIGARNG